MNNQFNWNQFITECSKRLPPEKFKSWIEPLQFVEINEKGLILATDKSFVVDWVSQEYGSLFTEVLSKCFDLNTGFQIIKVAHTTNSMETNSGDSSAMLTMLNPIAFTKSDAAPQPVETSYDSFETPAVETSKGFVASKAVAVSENMVGLSVSSLTTPVTRTLGQSLNPNHTFETFIEGASNQFACAAAKAVANKPGREYNPLFLYGNSGLGKTHLLHAIGNHILKMNPKAKVLYIPSEKFLNELIEGIRGGKQAEFRQKYRNGFDVLLMDDIQFFANKDAVQEEFFHTFNALHSSNKQIVVAGDKYPKDIPGLEERIISRFEWGLVADIHIPDIETRIAILRSKAETMDVFLPNDVALYLASNIKNNIRELEGVLIRLGAKASLLGVEVSLDLAKQELKNVVRQASDTVSYDSIIDAVCKHFGIKTSDIKSKERSRRVAVPRQIAMYLIRKHSRKSYDEIGLILGGKDHSTVMHGVRVVQDHLQNSNDSQLASDIKSHVDVIQNGL